MNKGSKKKVIGGRYQLKTKIGSGGMSKIYLADDLKTKGEVAIKLLDPNFSQEQEVQKRFLAEIKILSRINHPSVLRILNASEPGVSPLWFAAEYIKGKTIEEFFVGSRKSIHPIVATFIVCEIAKAIESIHSYKVIHRDIKPSNIMLKGNGQIKLLDFGISKDLAQGNSKVTQLILGTPDYISPEQKNCEKIDFRTDIYSLGAIYHYLLTGDRTDGFEHSSNPNILHGMPLGINKILFRSLQRDRNNRFSSAKEFRNHIEEFIKNYGFNRSDKELAALLGSAKNYQLALKKRFEEMYQKELSKMTQNNVATVSFEGRGSLLNMGATQSIPPIKRSKGGTSQNSKGRKKRSS